MEIHELSDFQISAIKNLFLVGFRITKMGINIETKDLIIEHEKVALTGIYISLTELSTIKIPHKFPL